MTGVLVLATTAGHGNPLHLVLAFVAALAVYALVVLVSPTRRCPRCHGERVTRHRRRAVPCPRCHTRGRVFRPRARLVHRAFWLAAGERLTERRKAARRALDASDRTED